jgi:hypothetical protein
MMPSSVRVRVSNFRRGRGLGRADAEERCRAVLLGAADRHERSAERLRQVADGREHVVVEVSLVQQIGAARQRDVESEGQSTVRRRHEWSGQSLELAEVGVECSL